MLNTKGMVLAQHTSTYFSSLVLISIIVLYKEKRAFFLLIGEKAKYFEGTTAIVTL